uniref:Uncharacterized protein n=1 Tax=Junco hyemalis TaxID=40217 RepID=A0A8C5IPI8_JUNHY
MFSELLNFQKWLMVFPEHSCVPEAEKLNKMSSLLERLHAKYSQNRPWTETMKLVRQVMEKRVVLNSGGHQHLVSCLETLQKALKVSSLPAMTDRLESIARQSGWVCSSGWHRLLSQ